MKTSSIFLYRFILNSYKYKNVIGEKNYFEEAVALYKNNIKSFSQKEKLKLIIISRFNLIYIDVFRRIKELNKELFE